MRRVLLLVLIACQSSSTSVRERAAAHTQADRVHAKAALSAALDEVYAALEAKPADTQGALARARTQLATFYTADEAAAFELWTGSGDWVLYIPTESHTPTVWLARTSEHLIVEPDGLPAAARPLVGL